MKKWRWRRERIPHGYAINPRVDQETTRNTESFIDWNYFLLRSSSYFSACRFFHSTLSIIRISHRDEQILEKYYKISSGWLRVRTREERSRLIFVRFPENRDTKHSPWSGLTPEIHRTAFPYLELLGIISRDRVKRKILIEPLLFFEAA